MFSNVSRPRGRACYTRKKVFRACSTINPFATNRWKIFPLFQNWREEVDGRRVATPVGDEAAKIDDTHAPIVHGATNTVATWYATLSTSAGRRRDSSAPTASTIYANVPTCGPIYARFTRDTSSTASISRPTRNSITRNSIEPINSIDC